MNYENQTDKIYLNWTGFGYSFKYRAFASTSSGKICNQAIGVVKVLKLILLFHCLSV